MYIGAARTDSDVAAARELAASVFVPPGAVEDNDAYKAFLWSEPGFPGGSHVVIAKSNDGHTVGTIRLLPRRMRRGDQVFRVAGISSVCIAESHRGRGISRDLNQRALEVARELGYELVVLFARRAVDHFYPRFDIWGAASYSRLTIAGPADGGEPLTRRPMTESDIGQALGWHQESYGECFGYFERSAEHFAFVAERARHARLSISVLERGGEPVGYVVLDGVRAVELSYGSCDTSSIVNTLLHEGQLTVDAFPRHKLRRALAGLDVSATSRVCEFGGHMIGVVDRDAVCRKLEERVRLHAHARALPASHEVVDGVDIRWDGATAHVRLSAPPASPLGLATTCRLVGARLATVEERSLLAPAASLDILALDQF